MKTLSFLLCFRLQQNKHNGFADGLIVCEKK